MQRTRHRWETTVARPETGESKTVEIFSYWDPERLETPEDITTAAAAETTVATRTKHVGVGKARLLKQPLKSVKIRRKNERA